MSARTNVTSDGDYYIGNNVDVHGRFTVAWSSLVGARIQLFAHHVGGGADLLSPLADGMIDGTLLDGQGRTIYSLNGEARCDGIVARVTSFSAPFEIWFN